MFLGYRLDIVILHQIYGRVCERFWTQKRVNIQRIEAIYHLQGTLNILNK